MSNNLAFALTWIATLRLTGCCYARLLQQLHEQHALLYCLGLTQSVFSLLCCSGAWHSLSGSILCFLFSSVVCRVLRRSLREHDGTILDNPQSFVLRKWWFHITYPSVIFTLRTLLWDCREIATSAFSNLSQCDYCYSTNTNVFMVWCMNTYVHLHTYIHTYIHTYRQTDTVCVQHVNVGLTQARPNYFSGKTPLRSYH